MAAPLTKSKPIWLATKDPDDPSLNPRFKEICDKAKRWLKMHGYSVKFRKQ